MKLREIKKLRADLRSKDAPGLQEELLKLRREQFNLRMARATGSPPKPDQWSTVRRNIARLKTVQGSAAAKANNAKAKS